MTVSAQIVAGCGLKGGGQDFGTLDFGVLPAMTAGDVSAVAQGGSLQFECTPGSTLRLSVGGGLKPDAANQRRNLQGPGGALVAYQLYADASRTQVLGIGQTVTLSVSGVVNLPIYGSLTLPGGALPAGVYTDTAQVTVTY
nr:spore coat U domain-containing protein [Pandoraea aquatica]